MNLKTAALRLGVHYQTVYRWVRSGELVAVKVGAGYEVSDAAVERLQAQRAARGRTPDAVATRPVNVGSNVDDALHVLDVMVDAVTLDSTAVGERAVRVIADHLGDAVFLYRCTGADLGEPGSVTVVYAAHRDPVGEVAASTLGRDPRTSTNLVRRTIADGRSVCVAQVPQRELRRRLHPELHEHLHQSGCYSALVAPIDASGALLVTRDLPGRPYGADALALVEAIGARVARADERARSYADAWKMRRAMVTMFSVPKFDAGCFARLRDTAMDCDTSRVAEPAFAALDLELRYVAANSAYAALVGAGASCLTGTLLRSLVCEQATFDEALRPVLDGEIDFRSLELEVAATDGRVALHVAMVRTPDATPRGIVLVAHAVPSLSVG